MATTNTLPKKVLKLYLPPLIKNLNEADPITRETSSEALGALLRALGDKIMLPNLTEVEQIKQDKIKEYAEKCVLLNSKGEPRTSGAAALAAPKPQTKVVVPPPKTGAKVVLPKPGTKAPAKPTEAKKPVAKPAFNEEKKPTVVEEADMHSETVDEKATELLGAECCTQLGSSNWKERLAATETIQAKIKSLPSDEVPVQVLVRTVGKKPGFKDTHFQVLKQRIELVSMLTNEGFKFSQRSASYCLCELADKIGDIKVGGEARDCLSKVCVSIVFFLKFS